MHVLVATDGSPQSLVAARRLMSSADPAALLGVAAVRERLRPSTGRVPTLVR